MPETVTIAELGPHESARDSSNMTQMPRRTGYGLQSGHRGHAKDC